MRYRVTGRAINRTTREPAGKIRTEIINTSTNKLFKKAKSPRDVEKRYESFWNDLNPRSKEIVKVIGVKKIMTRKKK